MGVPMSRPVDGAHASLAQKALDDESVGNLRSDRELSHDLFDEGTLSIVLIKEGPESASILLANNPVFLSPSD